MVKYMESSDSKVTCCKWIGFEVPEWIAVREKVVPAPSTGPALSGIGTAAA